MKTMMLLLSGKTLWNREALQHLKGLFGQTTSSIILLNNTKLNLFNENMEYMYPPRPSEEIINNECEG